MMGVLADTIPYSQRTCGWIGIRDFTKIGCIIKMGNKDKLSAKRLDKLSAKRLDHSNIIKIVINNNNEYFITEDGILEYVHVQRFYENYNRLRDIPTWRELDKLVFRECEKKNHPWLKGL